MTVSVHYQLGRLWSHLGDLWACLEGTMYVRVAKERVTPMCAALFPGLESQTLSVKVNELSTCVPLSAF